MATNVALAMPDPDDTFESEEVVIERTVIAGPPPAFPSSSLPSDEDEGELFEEEIVIERTFDADGEMTSEESER